MAGVTIFNGWPLIGRLTWDWRNCASGANNRRTGGRSSPQAKFLEMSGAATYHSAPCLFWISFQTNTQSTNSHSNKLA